MPDDLHLIDAVGQAALVRDGLATPAELTDAAIARIEATNPTLNAVISERFEAARAEAASDLPDGPFRGVPILLKDLGAAMAGEIQHAGSSLLKALDYRAPADSHLVRRLRAAGFVILGRTNTPEFGSTCTTEPVSYGATHNPWNVEHSSGGSSGGSAAAVAARMVPVAHASDGGGSIRIPSSECGLFGLKPSRGRISRGPQSGEGWGGASTDGCVSVTVRDSAAVLDVMAGWEPGDPYTAPPPASSFLSQVGRDPGRLRIGVRTHHIFPGMATHPECVGAAEAAAELLASLGHEVVHEASPAALDDQSFMGSMLTVLATAMRRQLDVLESVAGREVGPHDVEPANWASAQKGAAVTGPEYLAALEAIHAYGRRMAAWWAGADDRPGFDLLLTPTIAAPPPRLGELVATAENADQAQWRLAELIPFTAQFNGTGQPAMSLPLGISSGGLPIGCQLVAAYGREDLLFRVAAQVETAAPWADRLPPTAAT